METPHGYARLYLDHARTSHLVCDPPFHITACGLLPTSPWRGVQTWGEMEHAAELPLCEACTAKAKALVTA